MEELDGRADVARAAVLTERLRATREVGERLRPLLTALLPDSSVDRAVVGLDGVVRVPWLRLVDRSDEGAAPPAGPAAGVGAEQTSPARPDAPGPRPEAAGVPVRELSVEELVRLAAPFLSGPGMPVDGASGKFPAGEFPAGGVPAGEDPVGADACLRAVEAIHVLEGRLAAGRLAAAGELAARTAEELLEEENVTDPGELSRTRREQWRRRAKMVTGGEIAALTGWGRGKSRELVAVALAPSPVRVAIGQGLAAGVASWRQVDRFWRATRLLAHEDAAVVARALFATDAPAAAVAVERLDVEGDLSLEPWQDAVFVRALTREVARAGSADPEGQARARAARRARRDAFAVLDDDGTGEVVVRGEGATSAACADRLHLLATRLRAGGDERSVGQLRADLAHALLLHGTLPLGQHHQPASPGTPDQDTCGQDRHEDHGVRRGGGGSGEAGSDGGLGDELISPAELERLAQVLTGTPAYHLQVIVPWDTLTGRPATSRPVTGRPVAGRAVAGRPVTGTCVCGGCTCPRRGGDDATDPGSPAAGQSTRPHGSSPPGGWESFHGSSPPFGSRWREGVGLALSRTPVFLTGAELRAMALAPGSTFSRILFDPADGRCLERSLTRYAPDRAMREQVLAADVTSRGVGSATLARDGQLDHVQAYLAGGATSEANLQALDVGTHLAKTRKEWAATIDARRDVTWTSFFGRLYRTRAHDYRQYLSTGVPLDGIRGMDEKGAHGKGTEGSSADRRGMDEKGADRQATHGSGRADGTAALGGFVGLRVQDRRHLASLLVYAALTARQVGARLEAPDDDPDGDDTLPGRTHPAIWLRRTRERDGRRTGGPRPGTPTPEQILGTPAATILGAGHWTDPFTRPEPVPPPASDPEDELPPF